jgi:hypothetical protein
MKNHDDIISEGLGNLSRKDMSFSDILFSNINKKRHQIFFS